MDKQVTKLPGFTLIEVLLTIALMGLILASSVSGYERYTRYYSLQTNAENVEVLIRQAQANAQGGKEDGNWGVYITSNEAVLYLGNDYASRDSDFDTLLALPGSITVSSTTEVNFARNSGRPAGTVSFTMTSGDENRTISVNELGTII